MNILFLLRLWPVFGGGETMTRLWANEFVKKGYNVHIAYFKYAEYGTKPFIDERIKCHYIKGGFCDEYTSNDIDDPANVCGKLCDIVRSESIDIVINQWLPKSYVQNIQKETQAKVIWCYRTMFAQPFEKPKTFKRWLKYTLFPQHYKKRIRKNAVRQVEEVLPFVDKYVLLSEAYRKQYLSWSKKPQAEKVVAIPNPIPFCTKLSNAEIEAKENVVLVVGRMQECTKKFSLVLKVWQLFEKSNIPEAKAWRLVMVGDGDDLQSYKQMAKGLKLHRVSFEGFQNPMPYYKVAKIFLMTSRIEGFGNVLLEAQQMGVVPIAMDSYPAVRDIILNGHNGILVLKDSIRSMNKALISLITDTNELDRLRNNGAEYIKQFSMDNVMERWILLLNELQK